MKCAHELLHLKVSPEKMHSFRTMSHAILHLIRNTNPTEPYLKTTFETIIMTGCCSVFYKVKSSILTCGAFVRLIRYYAPLRL